MAPWADQHRNLSVPGQALLRPESQSTATQTWGTDMSPRWGADRNVRQNDGCLEFLRVTQPSSLGYERVVLSPSSVHTKNRGPTNLTIFLSVSSPSKGEIVLERYLRIYCHRKHVLLFLPLDDRLPFLHLPGSRQARTSFCFGEYFSGLQPGVFPLPEVPRILSLPVYW